jgi:hypothetical protein
MLSWIRTRQAKWASLAAALAAVVLTSGCQSAEPEKKITYTPVDRSSQPAAVTPTPVAGDAKPNDPMNDPELARKGQEILQRTGGDVNKMNPAEKKIFYEAARNGHL